MQHLNVIPREQLCGQIGVSRSTIKRWNETRNFPAISSGLGLLMAIYGPPFPNYRSGPIQRERITAALLACSFASK